MSKNCLHFIQVIKYLFYLSDAAGAKLFLNNTIQFLPSGWNWKFQLSDVQGCWFQPWLTNQPARLFNNSSEFLIFTNMYPNHDTKGQNTPIKHTIIRGHHGFSVNNCSVIFIGLHTVWLLIILCGWGCLLKSIIISFVLIKWRWDSSFNQDGLIFVELTNNNSHL